MSKSKHMFVIGSAGSGSCWAAGKKCLSVLALLVLLRSVAFAPIWTVLDTPQDSLEIRRAVADRHELKSVFTKYQELIETRLRALKYRGRWPGLWA